jgi:hypothetical protein
MANPDRMLTPKQIAVIVRKIERHKIAIGKHRDALRAIYEDVEEIAEECDGAADNLEQAIESLSKYL